MHGQEGPKSMGVDTRGFPAIKAHDEAFRLLDPGGKPMTKMSYSVIGENDASHEAITQETGTTARVNTDSPERLKFALPWADTSVTEGAADSQTQTNQKSHPNDQ